jgi:hypothetical protein
MRVLRNKPLVLLGIAASISSALAVDKDNKKFTPPPIDSIEAKQANGGLTIAAVPYTTDEQAKPPFGKLNPYEHGILPVLVIMKNDAKGAIRLGSMKVEYIDVSRERIEATPASDVKYATAPKRPNYGPGPIPGIRLKGKNPLAAEEIELRAFAPKMLNAGESAHGFVYFHTGHRKGARLYITGIQDAASGQDLFYFDIPLD